MPCILPRVPEAPSRGGVLPVLLGRVAGCGQDPAANHPSSDGTSSSTCN